jgi:VWFA-related protein
VRTATATIAFVLSALGLQEPPRFSSSVEGVYVDVFVTQNGQPVSGLTAENFEIRDNGVRQEVRLVGLDVVPIAVLLIFDNSSSVAGEALGHLRAAGHAVLNGVLPGERAALVTFERQIAVRVAPTGDLPRVREALDRLSAFGSTALFDAAYVGFALPVHGARPVIVLFSDGEDNASWLEAEDIRSVAARSDRLLQAVGFRDASLTVDELRRIAESTGGRFWKAERSDRLESTFLRILEEVRNRYLLAFEPTGVQRAGEHRLEVRLKGAKGKVRSRQSYHVGSRR